MKARWRWLNLCPGCADSALLQHAQLLRLKPPHGRDPKIFKDWLKGNAFCAMPTEFKQWSSEEGNEKDLVALSGRYENVDLFTRWVFRVFIPFYHKMRGYKEVCLGSF